jgi:hypothetical protein
MRGSDRESSSSATFQLSISFSSVFHTSSLLMNFGLKPVI